MIRSILRAFGSTGASSAAVDTAQPEQELERASQFSLHEPLLPRRKVDKDLRVAVKRQNFGQVTELLNQDANPNAASSKGHTAVHHAAQATGQSSSQIMAKLQKEGGNPLQQSRHSRKTALHFAAKANNPEIAKLLVASDPILRGVPNRKGQTPLQAFEAQMQEIIESERSLRASDLVGLTEDQAVVDLEEARDKMVEILRQDQEPSALPNESSSPGSVAIEDESREGAMRAVAGRP